MVLFLDALAVFFMIGLGTVGFRRGLIEELGRLVGLIAAVFVGFKYYVDVSDWFLNHLSMSGTVSVVLSFSLLFTLILVAFRILTKMVHIALISKGSKGMNRSMGFVFGFAKGALVVMAVLWISEVFPEGKWSQTVQDQSRLAQGMHGLRMKLIRSFRWQDPVEKGESFLRRIVEEKEEPEKENNSNG